MCAWQDGWVKGDERWADAARKTRKKGGCQGQNVSKYLGWEGPMQRRDWRGGEVLLRFAEATVIVQNVPEWNWRGTEGRGECRQVLGSRGEVGPR